MGSVGADELVELGLRVAFLWWTDSVPWSLVRQVRLKREDTVILSWHSDGLMSLAPVKDARALARTIEATRVRYASSGSHTSVSRRSRAQRWVIPAAGVACAAAILLHS